MPLIELSGVNKTYRSNGNVVAALQEIDLQIEEGEFVALMGPSGSGKSTLLSILGAMNPPSSGLVRIDGIAVYDLPLELRADLRHAYLGFVFQQLQLIPYLTAMENVQLPLAITRLPLGGRADLARQALARVGLADKERRLPGQLSGGEQERVAVARAIANGPPILLADEPTGNLDTATGRQVMELFRGLNRDGLTIVMVTHNPDSAALAGRIVHIRDGRLEGSSR